MASLRVLHLRKGPHTDPSAGARIQALLPRAIFLDSCQRQLWISRASELIQAGLTSELGLEILSGTEAYTFLLRVATGLESQIVGETDIFGQLKEAWRRSNADESLEVLMQRLFEDTKDIRSRYLQNLGGASYGSLVRMLLKNLPGPTLIVGAGQIAQSVAPYLLPAGEGDELWLMNRSQENLMAIHEDLLRRQQKQAAPRGKIRVIENSPKEVQQAWQRATNVVVCTPFDDGKDFERVGLRIAGEHPAGTVIHLGGSRVQAGAWNDLAAFFSLDDLFALEKSQGAVRSTQIIQAARACEEKAKLRSLGSSITIPHGWEDLALFA